jgi:hypothetical protein
MAISKDGLLTIVFGIAAAAIATTPFKQTWWLAIPLWACTTFAALRWYRHQDGKAQSWRELKDQWESLSKREIAASHRLGNAMAIVHADHNNPPQKGWYLGGQDPDCRRDAELLGQRCGAILLSSGRVRATLGEQTKLASDNLDRWLYFLKEIGEDVPADKRMQSQSVRDGVTFPAVYHIAIDKVSKASIRGCTECLRRESE